MALPTGIPNALQRPANSPDPPARRFATVSPVTVGTGAGGASRWTWVAPVVLVTAVPLAVDPAAQLRFLAPKWLLVCAAIPAGMAVVAAAGRLRFPLARWWVAALAVAGVASLVGVAPFVSLAGSPQRNAGFLGLLVGAGAYVLGASTGDDPTTTRRLLRAAFVTGGVVGVGAVLERAGVDVTGLGDTDEVTRARSTWGSATFLGGHLVLVGPLAVAHLRSRDPRWRLAAGLSLAAMALALVLTGTRGAWLGALAAGAFIVPWREVRERSGSDRRVVIGVVGAVVLIGVAVLALARPSLTRSTAEGRIDQWRLATEAVAERPLFGSGLDTQRIVLPAFVDDAFERAHGSDALHDRAHNLFLDTLLVSGVAGLLVLVGLLTALGRRLWAAARSGAVARSLVAGLLGYFVHLQFAFAEATLDPIALLLCGTVLAMAAREHEADRSRTVGGRVPAAALSTVALAAAMWAGAELFADHRLKSALDHRAEGDRAAALTALDGATALAPARFDLHQIRARIADEAARAGEPADLEAAIDDLDAALDVAPDDPELLIDRASVLTAAGKLDEARREYDRILADRYPSSFRAHLGLGVVAASDGEDEVAVRSWRRAADLAPRDERPWLNLGQLYERDGMATAARGAYEQALEADPSSQAATDALARLER